MNTKTCTSKYHSGEREVPIEMFVVSKNGKISNRCKSCVSATTNAYQQSEHGKQVKSVHYLKNMV